MSRSRNIKPGFFKNDQLAECEPLARILFAGLWCEADREGRLEDRPKKIKAACLPYDECDCDDLLNQLSAGGFIVRYVVDGKGIIQVSEFAKHQNPHVKEAASSLPAPVKPGASTVQAEEIPERAGLIPSLLIPDSPTLIPESIKEQTPEGEEPPSGGPPVEQKAIDPIWGAGLAFLVRKGIPEKQARPLIGKLRKAAGDVRTGAILAKAEEDDISDPAPWLMAAAEKSKATGKPSAAADFRNTTYTGTPYDELPPELR